MKLHKIKLSTRSVRENSAKSFHKNPLVNNFENLTLEKVGSAFKKQMLRHTYHQQYYHSNIAQKMSPRPFKPVWGSPPQQFWEPPLLASSRRPSAGRPSCTSGRQPKSLRFGSLLLLKESLLKGQCHQIRIA
jgi:hypothetical protein